MATRLARPTAANLCRPLTAEAIGNEAKIAASRSARPVPKPWWRRLWTTERRRGSASRFGERKEDDGERKKERKRKDDDNDIPNRGRGGLGRRPSNPGMVVNSFRSGQDGGFRHEIANLPASGPR